MLRDLRGWKEWKIKAQQSRLTDTFLEQGDLCQIFSLGQSQDDKIYNIFQPNIKGAFRDFIFCNHVCSPCSLNNTFPVMLYLSRLCLFK